MEETAGGRGGRKRGAGVGGEGEGGVEERERREEEDGVKREGEGRSRGEERGVEERRGRRGWGKLGEEGGMGMGLRVQWIEGWGMAKKIR